MNPDQVILRALAAFAEEYGPGPGKPIAVIIAALDEAPSVAGVIERVPPVICGLETETILMDDGSRDGTGSLAAEAGALVCRFPVNLGQGHAFQAGYRLAVSRRADYIATTDADGQFDPGQIADLIAPLVAGEADFVNGSRRLGRAETTDVVRKAGVVFFGGLITLLTRVRITDPANGMRAFRSEVAAKVTLRQPQYQSSELLIAAISNGFRVKEIPVTVYAREAGNTKKGGNLIYGLRFARVVVGTWLAQRRLVKRPTA